jgi:ABC-type uncharacterized transport system substrate-binding protein
MIKRDFSIAVLSISSLSFHAEVFKAFNNAAQGDRKRTWALTKYFSVDADRDLMRTLTQRALKANHDFIFCIGASATRILAEEMHNLNIYKPTVFAGTGHPLQLGVVKSFIKPGGCFTGVEMVPAPPLLPIHLAKRCFPDISSIFLPYFPDGQAGNLDELAPKLQEEASALGIDLDLYPVSSREDIRSIPLESLEKHDALLFVEGGITGKEMPHLARMCRQTHTLIFASGLYCAAQGAACSYGAGIQELGLQAFMQMHAIAVERRTPSTMPVITLPNTAAVIINEEAVTAQGGVISNSVRNALDLGFITVDGHQLPIHLIDDNEDSDI